MSNDSYEPLDQSTVKLSDSLLNKIIGSRLRARRQIMGWNQVELGKKIGVSGQQIHKYEVGIDQLSALRLYELSDLLEIPVGYFFDHLDEEHHLEESEVAPLIGAPHGVEFEKYVRLYKNLKDPKLQKLLFETTRLFAGQLKSVLQGSDRFSRVAKIKEK